MRGTCFLPRLAATLLALQTAIPRIFAEIPPVPPAFPNGPGLQLTPGEVLFRQPSFRVTNVAYHNGHLYTNWVNGGGRTEWSWTDPSNIASLTETTADLVARSGLNEIPVMSDDGNHGHTKVGPWLNNIIRRESSGVNIIQGNPESWSVFGGRGVFWPWRVPFNWHQYSSGSQDITPFFVSSSATTYHSWDGLSKHGVDGIHILMGNILIVASDESKRGVAAFDISPVFETPPREPVLLDKISGFLGAYLPVLWRNYVIMARRDTNTVDVIDWSDPSNLRLVKTLDMSGTSGWSFNSDVPYVQAQDEFVFARRHKINMETLTPVLEFNETGGGNRPGVNQSPVETSQYMMPLGPYLVTGGLPGNANGIAVWAHQTGPDNRPPFVGYHIPRNGQTNYPTRAAISLLIHETLESYTIVNGESVLLRPAGGSPLDCWISFSHDDVLTITPKQPLLPNTTYEVVIPQGGIKDAAGNGIQGYSFSFSTGSTLSAGNRSPAVQTFTASQGPVAPGVPVTFAASATDPENDLLEYRFSFGDEQSSRPWSSSGSVTKTFSQTGRFSAKVHVRDSAGNVAVDAVTVTVASAPEGPLPTKSSSVAVDPVRRRVWTVNPDNDSVSLLNADTGAVLVERDLAAALGQSRPDPRSLAVAPTGDAWVACTGADRIVVLDAADASLKHQILTGYGSAPAGVAFARTGGVALVTTQFRGPGNPDHGQLLKFDASTRAELGRLELGPTARAIAVTGNGTRALVTRFLSPETHGVIWDVDLQTMTLRREILLRRDPGGTNSQTMPFDGPAQGKGVPNHLADIAIAPDHSTAWFVAKKDQTFRGRWFSQNKVFNAYAPATTAVNTDLSPEHTVRAMLGAIDLLAPTSQLWEPEATVVFGEVFGQPRQWSLRTDIDNSESPAAIEFSPRGDWMFVALQGKNDVAVFDMLMFRSSPSRTLSMRIPAGSAPQGVALDPQTDTLWIQNLLTRDLTRAPLASFFGLGKRSEPATPIRTAAAEKLPERVLAGKKLFYEASSRMSMDTYISCATCHLDGGHDGRVFDFTQRGEGLRNTTDLRGRSGMAHGFVHWTANFDEIQDFAVDIRRHFGGFGFLPAGELENEPLVESNGNRSQELDDLAAYLASLGTATVPKSPYRDASGIMTPDALAGQALFDREQCATCHARPRYTDSRDASTLHDVGTLRASSGGRLGVPIPGIDTPTLLGVWAGAPFFHDGSAETLEDVFRTAGGLLLQAEAGAISGGAVVADFNTIQLRGFSSVDRTVDFAANGATLTLEGVDAGPVAGIGALELRILPGSERDFWNPLTRLVVLVNGVRHEVSLPLLRLAEDWRRIRLEGVALQSGPSNTIVFRREDSENSGARTFVIDTVTVSRPVDLAQAAAHRRVLGLPPVEKGQILAYVRQLDGRDETTGLIENSAPVAVARLGAGAPRRIHYGDGFNTPVTLDGTGSTDPEGGTLSYLWTIPGGVFVGGTRPDSPVAQVVLPGDAPATLTLTVTDPAGLSNTAMVGVGVQDFAGRGWAHEAGWRYEYIHWQWWNHGTLGTWWINPATGNWWDGNSGWPSFRIFDLLPTLPTGLTVSQPGQPEAPLGGFRSGVTPALALNFRPFWWNNPAEGIRNNHFAARFQGFLEILQPGNYTFHLTTGSTGRLQIGGVPVVTLDTGNGLISGSGSVVLEPGRHPVVAAFSYGGFYGGGFIPPIGLEYEGPGVPRRPMTGPELTHLAERKRTVARAMFDEWVERNGAGTGHLTDPLADAGGQTLLEKFVHGGTPGAPARQMARMEMRPGGRIRFTLDRVRQAAGLQHWIEASTDMIHWSPPSGFSQTSEPMEPGFQRWNLERPMAPGDTRQFLRLRSELSPVLPQGPTP